MERALGVAGQGQAGWASGHLPREGKEGSVLLARFAIMTATRIILFIKCSFGDEGE